MFTFKTSNFTFTVTSNHGRPAKARIFVNGEADVDFSEAYAAEETAQKTSDYTGIRGVAPEVDALFDKLNRQVVKNKRAVAAEALAELKEFGEVENDSADYISRIIRLLEGGMDWNRYAGCSCPCSPGFVAKNQSLSNRWVTITAN